jgi:branched-chain amino acid transport system ATP-binding protein
VALGFDWSPARRSVGRFGRRGHAADAITEALATCGISHLSESIASELSYGTQRLVEIARAVVARPKLLLLDEPTAGMNESERAEIESVQRTLQKQGVTQVLVEHNMGMVLRMCTHVFVLNSGKLIASGTAAEIVNDPGVQQAYLGKARGHESVPADH